MASAKGLRRSRERICDGILTASGPAAADGPPPQADHPHHSNPGQQGKAAWLGHRLFATALAPVGGEDGGVGVVDVAVAAAILASRTAPRGRYTFRRRKQTIPITAIPANRARLPGSGTDSSPTRSCQWAARMAASASFTMPSPLDGGSPLVVYGSKGIPLARRVSSQTNRSCAGSYSCFFSPRMIRARSRSCSV